MVRIDGRGEARDLRNRQRMLMTWRSTARRHKVSSVDYGEVPAGASDYAMMEVVQRGGQKGALVPDSIF